MTTQPGLGQNQTGAGVWKHGVGMGSLTALAHLLTTPAPSASCPWFCKAETKAPESQLLNHLLGLGGGPSKTWCPPAQEH